MEKAILITAIVIAYICIGFLFIDAFGKEFTKLGKILTVLLWPIVVTIGFIFVIIGIDMFISFAFCILLFVIMKVFYKLFCGEKINWNEKIINFL